MINDDEIKLMPFFCLPYNEPHREKIRILLNKGAVTAKLIIAFVFATRIVQFLFSVFPRALENMENGLKNPCMEKSWNLKNDEISWKNHGILL